MKIDKEKINALCALPDDALWAEIVKIGAEHGFTLPQNTPSHGDMEKIRGAASGRGINLASALRIIDSYRRGAK